MNQYIAKNDKDDGDVEEEENLEDLLGTFHLMMKVKIYQWRSSLEKMKLSMRHQRPSAVVQTRIIILKSWLEIIPEDTSSSDDDEVLGGQEQPLIKGWRWRRKRKTWKSLRSIGFWWREWGSNTSFTTQTHLLQSTVWLFPFRWLFTHVYIVRQMGVYSNHVKFI